MKGEPLRSADPSGLFGGRPRTQSRSDDPDGDDVLLPGPFDIYETADGPRHVENPVRRRLLAMMRGRERTVPEMIALTGLGKSTVSAHLSQLAREGLLDYREDPRDRRCKLYYLTSRHVATATAGQERPPVLDPARDLPLDQVGRMQRLLLRTLLAELACAGLDLAPVVRETGRRVGELIGREHPAGDLEEWSTFAGRFWAASGLGRLNFQAGPPARLEIEACGLCCHMVAQATPRLCLISAGLLEGMASEALGSLVELRVTAPAPRGAAAKDAAPACAFEIRVATGPRAA